MTAGGNAIKDGETVRQKILSHQIGHIFKTFATYLKILLKTVASKCAATCQK